ncbi:hypothetical protein STXM2123_5448 [Streptomyces sp. F-3]|nr:hypothetical protein STXM2123_5448 [Streptomyces sp. F-3]
MPGHSTNPSTAPIPPARSAALTWPAIGTAAFGPGEPAVSRPWNRKLFALPASVTDTRTTGSPVANRCSASTAYAASTSRRQQVNGSDVSSSRAQLHRATGVEAITALLAKRGEPQ